MAESYGQYAWRETIPGTWTRDIDEAERFYHHLTRAYEGSGRVFFAITGHATVTVPLPPRKTESQVSSGLERALRQAWLQLRFECPTVASQVSYDWDLKKLQKRYQIFSGDYSAEEWLGQTFKSINTGQTGAEWANSDPPGPKVPTVFLITPPSTGLDGPVRRDIVFRAPHDTIDGMGTLHLLNSLISNASELYHSGILPPLPAFGSETSSLSPPLRVAAGISPSLSWKQTLKLFWIALQGLSPGLGVETASVPYKKGSDMPGKHQRVALELSESQTRQVLMACRNVGATATHAFHAALALVIRDGQKQEKRARRVRYMNYILANERRRCMEPFNSARHAAAVYHSVPPWSLYLDMTVPAAGDEITSTAQREEFITAIDKIRRFYHAVRENDEYIQFVPSVYSLVTKSWSPSKDGTLPPVPKPNGAPSASISSLGVIDRVLRPQHGDIEVSQPWVTGEELGTGLGLFLGTFNARLELSCVYNDAWHDEKEVREFLNNAWRVVRNGFSL